MFLHLVRISPNHISLPFAVFERAEIIESEKIVLYQHKIQRRCGPSLFACVRVS